MIDDQHVDEDHLEREDPFAAAKREVMERLIRDLRSARDKALPTAAREIDRVIRALEAKGWGES
jgi:hypothetical protein